MRDKKEERQKTRRGGRLYERTEQFMGGLQNKKNHSFHDLVTLSSEGLLISKQLFQKKCYNPVASVLFAIKSWKYQTDRRHDKWGIQTTEGDPRAVVKYDY